MPAEREVLLVELAKRGLTGEEAEDFLDSSEIKTSGLQVPPNRAAEFIQRLSEFCLFTGPLRFYIMYPKDSLPRLKALVAEVAGENEILEGTLDTKALRDGKDPIGDALKLIQEGFSGDADFVGARHVDSSSERKSH